MSQHKVRQNYIQADVLSATPQRLQLLLVEAAMKNVLKTKKFWEEGNISDAFDTLTRAQDIVAEILCSLDVESSPDIAKKLASIYVFIFRRLTEAGMTQNIEKLDDAYRVLSSERETWKLVCEKFGSKKTDGAVSSVGETTQNQIPTAAKKTVGTTAWSTSLAVGDNGTDSGMFTSVSNASASFTPSAAMPTGSGGFSASGTYSAAPKTGVFRPDTTAQPNTTGTPIKPTPTNLDAPLGQVDKLNPLGPFGPIPATEPMSKPPQNANAPTETTTTGNVKLNTPAQPIPRVPPQTKTSSFTWDG